MHVFMRKTAQGNEYWDTKEKKVVFVPVGSVSPSLESMNIPQLKKYAADNNIEIPAEAKKKEDILKAINEVLQ
ncbi:hypothetical protein MHI57_07140 [Cytobacillus sp. FSL K6-0129]|uniref:hypothetical protein n=1 Tax=Cytobacillus sp. FSL K6-0129 TaxID=2921421 RepID=UPI0030F8CCA0